MATSDFSLSRWIDETPNCSIDNLKQAAASDPKVWKKLPGAKTLEEYNYRYRNITDQQALTWLRKKLSSQGDTLKPEQLAKLKSLCKALGTECQKANDQQKESANLLTSLWRQLKTEYQIFRSDYALISQQKKALRDLKSFRDIDTDAACQLYWQAMPHLSKHERFVATAKFVTSGQFDRLLTKRPPVEDAKKEVLTQDEKEALKASAKELYKSKSLSVAIGEKYVTPEAKRVIVNALADVIRQQLDSPRGIWRQAKADLQGNELVAVIHHDLNLSESATTMDLIAEATAHVAIEKREIQSPSITQEDFKIKETYKKQIKENLSDNKDTSPLRKFYISKKPGSEHKFAEAIRKVQEKTAASPIEQPKIHIVTLDATQREGIRTIVNEMRERLADNRAIGSEGAMSNTEIEQLLNRIENHGRDYQAIFDEITQSLAQIQKKSNPELVRALMSFPKLWLLLQDLKHPLLEKVLTVPVSPALHRHLTEKGIIDYRNSLEDLYYTFNFTIPLHNDASAFENLQTNYKLYYDPKNPEPFIRVHNIIMTAALVVMQNNPGTAEAVFNLPELRLPLSLAIPAHYTTFHVNRFIDDMKKESQSSNFTEKQARALYEVESLHARLYEAVELNLLHGTPIPEKFTVDLLQSLQKYVKKYNVENEEIRAFLKLMNPPPKAEKKKET